MFSVEDAAALRDAGTTLTGVALDPGPRFGDEHFVPLDVAEAIGAAIVPKYLYDEQDKQRACIGRVLDLKPGFAQLHRGGLHDGFVPAFRYGPKP